MNSTADKIMTDARARIIWGDSPQSVLESLVSNGVSIDAASAKVQEFKLERNRELRRIGLRNIFVGGVLVAAVSITFWLWYPGASATSGIIRMLAFVLLAGIYAVWKLLKGITYLVRPQSEHKSIPDIEQSDILG